MEDSGSGKRAVHSLSGSTKISRGDLREKKLALRETPYPLPKELVEGGDRGRGSTWKCLKGKGRRKAAAGVSSGKFFHNKKRSRKNLRATKADTLRGSGEEDAQRKC